jgi:phosphopantothenoylcysteine synthetase/decarboxylase
MKQSKILFIVIFILAHANGFAQKNMQAVKEKHTTVRQLTTEPGIGIHTNFGTDFLISNLIQWNPKKRLALASHTSFNINNITQRNFNGIKTNYNYTLNQKFGVGTTFYSKRSSNTFLLMAGVKYSSFKETLSDPDYNKVSVSINSFSPDYGLMYSLKKGVKKYFFSFRMYVPLYPWPIKDINISSADGNMNNIALEFGVGIKIK